MGKAARAIVIEDGKILVMMRKKGASQYYTLVGGQIDQNEEPEQALIREVHEETGLQVTDHRLVFMENHPEPYNDQLIYLCQVAPHGPLAVQPHSEEGMMNRIEINIHEPMWVELQHFAQLPFSTMQLQHAIVGALRDGFPVEPINL